MDTIHLRGPKEGKRPIHPILCHMRSEAVAPCMHDMPSICPCSNMLHLNHSSKRRHLLLRIDARRRRAPLPCGGPMTPISRCEKSISLRELTLCSVERSPLETAACAAYSPIAVKLRPVTA